MSDDLVSLALCDGVRVEKIVQDQERELAFRLAKYCFEGSLHSEGRKAGAPFSRPKNPTQIADADTTDQDVVNEFIVGESLKGEVHPSSQESLYDRIVKGSPHKSESGQSEQDSEQIPFDPPRKTNTPVPNPHSENSNEEYESAPEDLNHTPDEMKLRNKKKVVDDPSKLI